MKKKTRRKLMLTVEARLQDAIDGVQEAWQDQIFSDAPLWGIALGLHLQLCELEHLEEAAEEPL